MYQKLTFCKFDSNTIGMFLLTLQKIPVSLSVIVTKIRIELQKLQKVIFWPKLPNFLLQNFNLICYCCETFKLVIFGFFLHERLLEIWLGQGKRYRQTDERTDGHTRREKQYMSPAGETYIVYHSAYNNENTVRFRK